MVASDPLALLCSDQTGGYNRVRLHRLQPWLQTNVTVNFNRTQISHLVVYVTLRVCVCVPETAQKRMSDITKTLSVCLNLIPAVTGKPSSKTTYVEKEINYNIPKGILKGLD